MTDIPIEDEWAETGLDPQAPDEDAAEAGSSDAEPPEHAPAPARPDLRGEAAEHDVIDQAVVVPEGDPDEYPEA